jgi:hypothetical protein
MNLVNGISLYELITHDFLCRHLDSSLACSKNKQNHLPESAHTRTFLKNLRKTNN